MGFYDEFDKPARKQGGGVKWIAVAIISALIGSGTTVALVPALIKANVIQVNGGTNNATNGGKTTTGGSKETVNVDVKSGVVDAVNAVKPAVVGVLNLQRQTDFFGRQGKEQTAGTGSGVVFDDKGHIVTNNHVVEGADSVEVSLQDGSHVKAKVIGTDPTTDLAVIQVDQKDLKGITPAKFGNSDSLNIGEPAIAIGNPLGMKFAQSVTVGVISATKRELPIQDPQTGQEVYSETVLQTDAAINPGNSGGALVNIKGEVIGINSAKIATSGVEGIGFAIPMNEAQPIIQQLLDKGKVERPALGIGGAPIAQLASNQRPAGVPVDTGVVVMEVNDNATKAGLAKGDVIVAVDGQPVGDLIDLRKALFKKQPGQNAKVEFYRGKDKKSVDVPLVKLSQQ